MYDVIIVGGSFGGLAVASQLQGYKVLILDKDPVGAHQTSACGTALPVLQYWGLQDTVLQVHDRIVLHTKRKTFEFPSPFLWCTFDYEKLCKQLFARSGAEFAQASVLGYRNGWVETNQGSFTAKCVVDTSGWRAILASSLAPEFSQKSAMNFGIETIQHTSALHANEGLHFWYDKSFFKDGVGWVFPRGETASYGLGSYQGAMPLADLLNQFMGRFEIHPDGIHGTYFPSQLRRATVGPIFLVGDSAGMCLGLSGEGIRPALYFGEACGLTLHRVLAGTISLADGLAEYDRFVEKKRFFFNTLAVTQRFLHRLPERMIDGLAALIQRDPVLSWVMESYWNLTGDWEPSDPRRASADDWTHFPIPGRERALNFDDVL